MRCRRCDRWDRYPPG
ncbi:MULTISPECIES: hypothetical protein [Rhodococcus]